MGEARRRKKSGNYPQAQMFSEVNESTFANGTKVWTFGKQPGWQFEKNFLSPIPTGYALALRYDNIVDVIALCHVNPLVRPSREIMDAMTAAALDSKGGYTPKTDIAFGYVDMNDPWSEMVVIAEGMAVQRSL
jgi:hypothetical protein